MKRALVLCGGGSLGAYEVGAWRYLREKGLHFDIVTGTSIGAINGAMVATDSYDECIRLWEEVTINEVMKEGFNISENIIDSLKKTSKENLKKTIGTYIKNKGVDITPFKALVKRTIDPAKIKKSNVTLGVVTTDYKTKKEKDIVLNDEPEEMILPWLHASSACWPIFPMECVNGKKYVDGGFVNNLPIDLALKLGAEEIVAVLLHAFPKSPQHAELMDAPFVTCIRPSRDTGTILYFESHVLKNNMMLGYMDAMKTFGDAWGFSYCFKKQEQYRERAKKVLLETIKNNVYISKTIENALFTKDMPRPKDAMDFYIRGLELLSSVFKINPYRIWGIDEIEEELISNIAKTNLPSKKQILTVAKNKDIILAKLMDDIKEERSLSWIDKHASKNPEIHYLKFLLANIINYSNIKK